MPKLSKVAEGDIAEVGQTIAVLITGGTKAGGDAASKDAGNKASDNKDSGHSGGSKMAMPAAQRVIAENNLDASSISGSGRGGRITKGDALSAKDQAPRRDAASMMTEAGNITSQDNHLDNHMREDRVRMSRLRQTIARRLKDAQNTAAMLTTYNEADMSHIMAMRSQYKELFLKKHGVKLGFMSFFVKAVVQALKDVPSVNAEIDGTDVIYKNYYDISIAVGTDKGLVVPVLRGCDALSLGGIEKGIGALGAKARDGKLSMDDMSGGTFTISNGGVLKNLLIHDKLH